MKNNMPLNYEKLSPKGKFIRTCICVPILLALLFGTLWFLATHFTLGPRFIIKASVAVVLCVAVAVWQLITTYKAWKDDEGYY